MAKYPTTEMCDGTFLEIFEGTTRDSDVFISTSAKCGQTWLQTLLFHLKTAGTQPDFGGRGLFDVSPWLELPRDIGAGAVPEDHSARLAKMEALADPRVFKMHVVWDEIPVPPRSGAKIITITRDPRDVPYSMFSHIQSMQHEDGKAPPSDFAIFFDAWFERGLYFELMRSYWLHRDDANMLILRYEELHRDIRTQIQRILDTLGWQCTAEELDRVLPLVDFERMRSQEKTSIFVDQRRWKSDGHFFREGGIGKNRARLSEEQEQRIVRRCLQDLGPECSEYVLSLPPR